MQKKNEKNYRISQNMDWQQKCANYYLKHAWILNSDVIKNNLIIYFNYYDSLCTLWSSQKNNLYFIYLYSISHMVILRKWHRTNYYFFTNSLIWWCCLIWCCSSPVTSCGINIIRILGHPVASRAAPYHGNNGKVFH